MKKTSIDQQWLVFGHFGGHNTGDEAMLMGLLKACPLELRERLVVVYMGEISSALGKINVNYIPPKLVPIFIQFIRCKGIILGGGTHFHDDYATIRYIRHFRYMARFVLLTIAAKLLGKRAVWISQGFGPFLRWPSRWLVRLGLAFCDFVTVREKTSKQEIDCWISSNKIELSFDLAALLLSDDHLSSKLNRSLRSEGKQVLGISVTSAEKSKTGGATLGSTFWDRFEHALESIFISNPTLQVRIFVIRGGERESDTEISKNVFIRLTQIDPERVELVPYDSNPENTYIEINGCNAFIATRFHSGVLAYLAGCDLLFIAYHRKLIDLAMEIGLDRKAWMSMTSSASENLIQTRIQELLNNPKSSYQPTLPIKDAVARAHKNIEVLNKYG